MKIDRLTLDKTSIDDPEQVKIFKMVRASGAWPSLEEFPLFKADRKHWKDIMSAQMINHYLDNFNKEQ